MAQVATELSQSWLGQPQVLLIFQEVQGLLAEVEAVRLLNLECFQTPQSWEAFVAAQAEYRKSRLPELKMRLTQLVGLSQQEGLGNLGTRFKFQIQAGLLKILHRDLGQLFGFLHECSGSHWQPKNSMPGFVEKTEINTPCFRLNMGMRPPGLDLGVPQLTTNLCEWVDAYVVDLEQLPHLGLNFPNLEDLKSWVSQGLQSMEPPLHEFLGQESADPMGGLPPMMEGPQGLEIFWSWYFGDPQPGGKISDLAQHVRHCWRAQRSWEESWRNWRWFPRPWNVGPNCRLT
jgi:hypothetical protein